MTFTFSPPALRARSTFLRRATGQPGFRFILAVALLLPSLAPASARNLVVFTNLVSFNGTNGQQPSGPLLQARDGNFYGTALYGGTNASYAGTVFRMTSLGAFSNLLFFNVTNGTSPNGGLIQGVDGNFYGTTAFGGAFTSSDTNHNGFGTVFQLTSNGVLTTLASFSGANGKNPNALFEASAGVFYGTANTGGAHSNFAGFGFGTLFATGFRLPLTNLLSFNDANGAGPSAGLTMATNGVLFGTTTSGGLFEYGTAFRLAADGSISSEFSFTFTNGAVPNALVYGRDGKLYGTTQFGGSNRFGTIFQLTTNLALTTLVNLNGTNGAAPTAMIQGGDGNFYGVTSQGGTHGFGTVFQLATNGALLTLYSFTGGSDGYSGSSLVQGTDGNFYGTTSYGGNSGLGNVFKLSVIPAPTIQTLSRSNNTLAFTWTAVSNMTYEVQYITNLTKTNWTLLKSVTASNTLGTVTDTIGPDPRRFYRVSLASQ